MKNRQVEQALYLTFKSTLDQLWNERGLSYHLII